MEKKSFLLGTLTGVMTRGQILSHATRINYNLFRVFRVFRG